MTQTERTWIGAVILAAALTMGVFAVAAGLANKELAEAAARQEVIDAKRREFFKLSEKTRIEAAVMRGEMTEAEARFRELRDEYTIEWPARDYTGPSLASRVAFLAIVVFVGILWLCVAVARASRPAKKASPPG